MACSSEVSEPAPAANTPPTAIRDGKPPEVANAALADPAKLVDTASDPAKPAHSPAATADADATTAQVTAQVTDLLSRASGTPAQIGHASTAILQFGAAALPGLATGLGHTEIAVRRLAATTALQLAARLPANTPTAPMLAALRAAADDKDPAVRAAVQHAIRIYSGDTSELDAARQRHEAAEAASR
jgi:hypothetical protein